MKGKGFMYTTYELCELLSMVWSLVGLEFKTFRYKILGLSHRR